jgi:hypothetical protein
VHTSTVAGTSKPSTSPAEQPFWRYVGNTADGTLTLTSSEVRGQQLALVVMAPDARSAISIDLTAGLSPKWLNSSTWGLLILGTVALLLGIAVLIWPTRPREIVYVVDPSQLPDIAARLGAPMSAAAKSTAAAQVSSVPQVSAAQVSVPQVSVPQVSVPQVSGAPQEAAVALGSAAAQETVGAQVSVGAQETVKAGAPESVLPSVPAGSPAPSVPVLVPVTASTQAPGSGSIRPEALNEQAGGRSQWPSNSPPPATPILTWPPIRGDRGEPPITPTPLPTPAVNSGSDPESEPAVAPSLAEPSPAGAPSLAAPAPAAAPSIATPSPAAEPSLAAPAPAAEPSLAAPSSESAATPAPAAPAPAAEPSLAAPSSESAATPAPAAPSPAVEPSPAPVHGRIALRRAAPQLDQKILAHMKVPTAPISPVNSTPPAAPKAPVDPKPPVDAKSPVGMEAAGVEAAGVEAVGLDANPPVGMDAVGVEVSPGGMEAEPAMSASPGSTVQSAAG